jgi:hypothetical protein
VTTQSGPDISSQVIDEINQGVDMAPGLHEPVENISDIDEAAEGKQMRSGRFFKERKYDPAKQREDMRGLVTRRLLWVFCAMVAAPWLVFLVMLLATKGNVNVSLNAVKEITAIVLTPVVGLVGAATGFYFGERMAC